MRRPFSSARPTRGVLLATLFSLVIVGMVTAFGAVEAPEPVIEATETITVEAPEPPPPSHPGDRFASGPAPEPAYRVYDDALGALEGMPQPEPEQRVLSATPEPAPPTTVETTTTTTTAAAEETTTTTVEGETTTTSTEPGGEETTTTTVEGETTTTTGHPEGWVDAGHGVFVPPILLSIRWCESRDDYQAANPRSSARGAYQFLTSSWAGYGHAERYGVNQAHLATNAQQDEAALITWQRDGTRPWNASRSCWG